MKGVAGPARTVAAVLPDLVAPDLDILFCGTAAGRESARRGAYYAGPGNAFWPTLHRVGLIPEPLRADEFPRLLHWRMGLTDLAKHVAGSDATLRRMHFDAVGLGALIEGHRPRVVAFTSKRAAEEFLGRPVAGYGLLPGVAAPARIFVLPSPSGAARRWWDEGPWRELRRLRDALGTAP